MKSRKQSGFTLIELMIVITIIAVLLALAIPSYRDYTIRAKVAEGLSVASAAKLASTETCQSAPTLLGVDAAMMGYNFSPSTYVADVQVAASCALGLMMVAVQTQNTGAENDPVIVLLSDNLGFFFTQFGVSTGRVTWQCVGLADSESYLPSGCRAGSPEEAMSIIAGLISFITESANDGSIGTI